MGMPIIMVTGNLDGVMENDSVAYGQQCANCFFSIGVSSDPEVKHYSGNFELRVVGLLMGSNQYVLRRNI